MRFILFISCFLVIHAYTSVATSYYVGPAGNDGNSGLSVGEAFATLQHAAMLTAPGDTVFALTGTYTNDTYGSDVLDIYNSGTSSDYIVYENYPGDKPVILLYDQWNGIHIQGAHYIIIDGFTIIGNNGNITLAYAESQEDSSDNPATSGNGIGCTMEYSNPANKPHHDIIRNCVVSMCGGGGIYTYNADYITITNDTVTSCGWYSPYENSGISLYQNWNSDSSTAIKNYVTGNVCYQNRDFIPSYTSGYITDGNGIILDDSRNTQNGSMLGAYVGKTYIANNVVFANGGRGIHAYSSDKAVVVNNTCFKNCQSAFLRNGDYGALQTDSIYFINNISYPDSGIAPIDTQQSTNMYIGYNFWAANAGLAIPTGTNAVSTGAAGFINPTTAPATANFGLASFSAAIGRGTHYYAPATDITGRARPAADSVDIGAYQYTNSSGLATVNTPVTLKIFPDPAVSYLYIDAYSPNPIIFNIAIFNMAGVAMDVRPTVYAGDYYRLDVSKLQAGMYNVIVYGPGNDIATGRFCKVN